MIWPFRRRSTPDPDAMMQAIAGAWSKDYTPEQRYADFRQLFMGSDQGRRVLYQILVWSHLWRPSHVKGDTHGTAFAEGERNLGLRIVAALNVEPKRRPARQTLHKAQGD